VIVSVVSCTNTLRRRSEISASYSVG